MHITGDIILNANLTISNCTFAFDPGTQILVPAGYTLTITNGSELTADTDEMWDGIRVETGVPGIGKVIINGSSVIANAIYGVHIVNTVGYYADFEINDDVVFCNNYHGMHIEGYGGAHPGLVEETTFCGPALLDPYDGDMGVGVYIIENKFSTSNITIGNGNTLSGSSGYNEFYGLQYGIQLDWSTATIQNNYFHDIITGTGSNGHAIHADGIENEVSVTAYIGETGIGTSYSNYVEDCEEGIHVEHNYNTEIHHNHIANNAVTASTSVMKYGMYITDCQNIHNILNNRVTNVDRVSIFMYENGSAYMDISENEIPSSLTVPATPLRRGIAVADGGAPTATITIDKNDMTNLRIGISVVNNNGDTYIRGNDISVTYNGGTEPSQGVLANNCPDVLIDVFDPTGSPIPNTITGVCSSGCEDQIIGINIQDCQDFRCYRNYVEDCYPGIRAEGDCTGGNFVCNEMDNCTWGFGLKNLDDAPIRLGVGTNHEIFGGYYLGGSTELPSDNQWTPSSGSTSTWANRTHAYEPLLSAFPTGGDDLYWYYRSSAAVYDMEPATTLNTKATPTPPYYSVAIPSASLINTASIDPDIVPYCSFPMPRVEEEEESESLMDGSDFADTDSLFYAKMSEYFYTQLSTESTDDIEKHLIEEGAFILLKNYPPDLWDNEYTDAIENTVSASNTAYYHRIFDSIGVKNFDAAKGLFNEFTPSGIAEQNMYDVMEIYLNSRDENGKLNLGAEDSIALEHIAYQHTLEAGLAVNNARAMLDIYVEFDNTSEETERHIENLDGISVYPNPTDGFITIECNSKFTFKLFSITGILILSSEFENNQEIINISSLSPGVYIYEIINPDTQEVVTSKLIKN